MRFSIVNLIIVLSQFAWNIKRDTDDSVSAFRLRVTSFVRLTFIIFHI